MKMNPLTKWMSAIFCILCFCLNASANESNRYETIDANEDVAEVQAAMMAAKAAESANSARRSVMLMSSGGIDTYTASGDLDEVVGSGNLNFTFKIDKPYTEITSAKLHINAYDVDYPSNNEHDKVYFNGEYVGRFKGANGEYRVNTFTIKPSLIKCPSSEGATAVNRFSVAVNVDNGGWVTGVGWAKLEINGETFSVNASDGTEIGGIKVKWSNMGNGTYELYRRDSKNVRFNLISEIKSTTTYVDTSVAWGRQYWYFVKFNEMESNIDVGLSGSSGVLPRVDKVEVAKLWLTGKGPYNVRVTWNDFDRDRYAVDQVSFDVSDTDLRYTWNTPSLNLSQNTTMDFDLSKSGKIIGEGLHGRHNLSIAYLVYDRMERGYIKNSTTKFPKRFISDKASVVNVFFEKYKTVHGVVPNWYRYWFKDGTIDIDKADYELYENESERRTDKIYYDSNYTGTVDGKKAYRGGYYRRYPKFSRKKVSRNTPSGCPDLYILTGDVKGFMAFTHSSVCSKRPFETSKNHVGTAAKGVEALASLISHEREHRIMWRRLMNHKDYYYIGIDSNYDKVSESDDRKPLLPLSKILDMSKGTEYYNILSSADSESKLIIDSDGDGLSDAFEDQNAEGFNKRNSDTFNLAVLNKLAGKNGYSGYGDNEYLARGAENRPVKCNVAKDWAYPGYNMANEYSGIKIDDWQITNKEYRITEKLQSLDNVKYLLAKMNSIDLEEDDSGFYSGALSSMPELEQYESARLTIVGVAQGCAVRNNKNFIKSIDYIVTITNNTEDVIDFYMKGYLSTSNDTPIAWSSVSSFIAAHKTESIKLSFSGETIYSQRVDLPILLRYVVIENSDKNMSETWVACVTNVTTEAQYALDQYDRKNGYLFCDKIRSYTTNQTVVLDVPIEINGDDVYKVKGVLETTNGTFVASAITQVCSNNLSMVQLVFNGEDIYLSQQKSPYNLASIQILDSQNKVVDGMWDAISIEDISYERFKSNDSILSVAHNSFKEENRRISADGKYDGLFFGFVCTNTANEDVKYQVSGTLLGANNIPVAKCSKEVILTNGCNYVSVIFNGASIKDSGTDGPYVVSQIEFTPIVEGGCSERFLPVHVPIELKACDFGQAPFTVAGNATCREIDKYTPIVVDVPVHVSRSGKIIASAIITDRDGNFLLRSETNVVVSVGSNQTVSVAFTASELMATGSSGPYVVSYLLLQSGYEGVEEIRIDEFEETREVDFSIYVDAVSGNDSNDGLTPEAPKKSLVAAVSFALEGTTVYVGAGDYTCPSEIGEGETYLTIAKKVNLVAQNKDPAKTRIIGPGALSTNDIRGVWLAEGAMISGFTITNFTMSAGGGVGIYGEGLGAVVSNCVIAGCNATHDGGGVYQCSVYDSTIRGCRAQNGGGAAQCKLIRCTIEDNVATQYGGGVAYGAATNCIIRKCTATNGGGGVAYANVVVSRVEQNKTSRYGGGGYSGSLERCFVGGNVANYYGGGLASGTAYDCVIKGNSSSREGGGADSATLYNCTVVGNSATQYGGGVYSGRIVNSIVWGNTAAISNNHYRAQGVYNCTTPLMAGEGNIDTDPKMRGAEFGGFMLSSASPCLDAGLNNGETAFVVSASGVTNATKAIVLDQDFFGNVRTQDGRVDMGAVEGVTNACLVMTKTVGYGSLDVSFELLTPHSSLTVTADESVRPIDRIEISNGRIVRDPKVTLEDITTDVFITAYFKYYDFYVDAENGDDANDGFSAATAKRTIQVAVDCAMDVEKIFVSKGRYAPISTNDKKIEVVATDGVSLTFIDGGKTNRCATLANESSSVSTQTNTVLVGFTLTNGRATSGGGSYGGTLNGCVFVDNTAAGADYCYGGGSYYGVQYDCQYRNNATEGNLYGRGGAAYYGTSYNCSYVNNSAAGGTEGNGGAVYYGTHYDCALTNNTASTYGGGGYGGAWYRVTVHKNKAATGGGLYEGSVYVGSVTGNKAINGEGGGTYKTYLNDCYIANNQASGNGGGALLTDDYAYRCAFVNNRSLASGGGVYGGICYDCGITNNVAVSNGGGAYNVTATRTSIVGNSAVSGGGVYNGTYNFCTVSGNTASSDGGGAYNGTFNDSEISGNTASGVGGGAYYATVHRTKILSNTAISDGGGMYRGSGYNSLIAKNKTVAPGGGVYNATLYNCTVTENWSGNAGGGTYNGSLYNTIIYGNTNPDGVNNVVGSSQTSCKTSNPDFVNAKEGDYRLRVGSSCINSGNASYVNGSTDLALADRVQDGRVDIGAYEGGVEGHVVSVESLGVGKLEYGACIVTNGGSFVISAQDTGRRFLHFKTNGVIATTSPILTLDGVSDDVTVTAEFVHEMFVDGASGSDDSDGLSWESAKKTIQAAIDASVDGDTIWVADGVYEPIDTADKRIDIVSVNGAEAAIIDGGGIACCVRLGDDCRFSNNSRLSGFTLRNGYATYGGGVQYGRADNCIIENCHATGHGGGVDYSSLSNCVIRNNIAQDYGGGCCGNTWNRYYDCSFIGNAARSSGGGAHMDGGGIFRNCYFEGNTSGDNGGALYNGVVHDSIFTRNRAVSGGATYNGTFYRCLVENNTSTGDGGGTYYGTFYDSIITNNTASGSGGGSNRGTFHRSHILQNKALSNGGGVYNGTSYNSIIVKNTANGSGGGSYSGYNYNCTIVENYAAASGGGTYSGTQYNSIVWNNNNHYGVSNLESGSQYNCCTVDPLFVNAAEGDYRVRNTSACINAGNASYVNGSYDVAQRTRVQDGTVDIGAHEGGVGGFVVNLDFKGGASAEHSSVIVSSNGTFTVYSISSERPFVGCFTNGVFVSASLPFTLSGIVSDVDLSIECAHTLYVDADSGVDDKDGFDWANAKRSIQAAIDVSLSGDVIYVADGWYEPFVSENRKIRIVSENGPENCIVDGEFSARCATLGKSASEVQTVIEGLTLCNGHSTSGGGCAYGTAVNCVIEDCYSTGNGGGAYQTILKDCDLIGNIARSDGGGAYGDRVVASGCLFMDNTSFSYGGGAYSGAYYDSVFDGNCASSRGGAAYGATLQRCILKGNDAPYGGGTYNGTMYSCLYYDNYASSSAGGAYYGTLYNCTLTRNKSASAPAGSYYPTAYNTIIWGNLLNSGSVSDCSGSSYYNCCQTGGSGTGLIAEDPKFFDPANDDFRLSRESPCRDVGNNSNVKESTDILGATRIQDETVDMGCYENAVMVWDISVVVCGDGRVIDYGKSILDKGSLMFEAVEMGFPFLGFYTNGVFATSDKEFTWKNISSDGTLEAWFKQDIYVDSAKIDDSGDGLTWETARKDLTAVVAEIGNGANIWVKSGIYAPIVSMNKHLVITAVDGSPSTIIDGGGTTWCCYAYTNNVSISAATNTVLTGFTLRNGYAQQGAGAYGGTLRECVIESCVAERYGGGTYYGVQYDCAYSNNSVVGTSVARGGAAYYGTSYRCTYKDNSVLCDSASMGGGIFGGRHYDCIIKDNTAGTRGGGVANATCYRCILTGNSATIGGASYSGTLRECLLSGNVAENNGGASRLTTLYGCTVVNNFADQGGGLYDCVAYNSIVWGNRTNASETNDCSNSSLFYSCFFGNENGYASNLSSENIIANGSFETHGTPSNDSTWGYGCAASPWTMSQNSGITYSGSPWTSATLPNGSVGCFMQQAVVLSQKVEAPMNGTYRLTFYHTSRGSSFYGLQIAVQVDAQELGAVIPKDTTFVVQSYDVYLEAGEHTVKFVSSNTTVSGAASDQCAVIDAVSLVCLGGENSHADPKFEDAENGNYRLSPDSPCVDAGCDLYVVDEYDIIGNVRKSGVTVDIGCYESSFSIATETQTTPEPVPYSWLENYSEVLTSFGGDYEAMANAPSPGASGSGKIWPNGSPCYMWQDFVAGTSPTNDAVFTATIRMDGDTPVITWEPDTPELRATRVYRTYGKKTLMDANWTDITDKDMSEYNFFKVTVDLP